MCYSILSVDLVTRTSQVDSREFSLLHRKEPTVMNESWPPRFCHRHLADGTHMQLKNLGVVRQHFYGHAAEYTYVINQCEYLKHEEARFGTLCRLHTRVSMQVP